MSCATRAAGAVGVGLIAGVVTLGTVGVPLAAAAPVKAGRMVAATTTVNIRTGPSIKHKIIGQLERGQQITAVGPAAGQWIKVRLAGSVAYMSANYLNTTGRRLPAAPTRSTRRHQGHDRDPERALRGPASPVGSSAPSPREPGSP